MHATIELDLLAINEEGLAFAESFQYPISRCATVPYQSSPISNSQLATITMAARGQTSYYEILGIESSVSQDAVSKGECLSMLMAHLARRSSSSIFAPCSYPHQPTARGLCRRILIEEETRPSSRRSQSELG